MIAAVYARKSTEQSGVSDDQKSVARQIDQARLYAARKGWAVADEHVYIDDGISGAEFASRAGFVRLMAALKPKPPFQALIMSEESRLGREAIETAYALKQLVTAGVRVFFYLEDRERTLDSPTDKIMLSLTAFADELEREKARQRTYDAMQRKARPGHVCGGRTFGYDNVDVPGLNGERSHVTYAINPTEAASVRRIFELCAMGEGFKSIAKRLNDDHLLAPRPQQQRPRGWTPSTVREILFREIYRGRRVWNKTRKRDTWGHRRQHDRPADDWLTIGAESLRVVSEELWQAAHARMGERRANYVAWKQGQGGAPDGRGVRTRYFLTGFARCAECNGSMEAVSIASGTGRARRYGCSTYRNRGKSICANGRMAHMHEADDQIRIFLKEEVLKPKIVNRAFEIALGVVAEARPADRREELEGRLVALDAELANLIDLAARAGASDALAAALSARSREREQLRSALAAVQTQNLSFQLAALRREFGGFLAGWRGLLERNTQEARGVLSVVLRGRVAFKPLSTGEYELTIPIAFDRIITTAIPDLRGLQDRVASPTGFALLYQLELLRKLNAA
jgi:site-specific DNA recombinase